MRKLKFHEQKLLKKVDFLQWKSDQNIREIQNRNAPSGKSQVYQATQLRTDDVHYRESASTGPVVLKVLRRYLVQNRDDYAKYDKMAGLIKRLTAKLKTLDPSDEFRIKMTEQLLDKLYSMGVINAKTSLAKSERLTVSAFCRRRLPVVMVRLKMSQTLTQATTFIEQGQVRVGPHAVTDPAYLVTRSMEDFVTWVDGSKIKRAIKNYEDKLDDFDLLGEG